MLEVYGEQARFRRFEVYGAAVARPGATAELDLVQAKVPAGQYLFASGILQSVRVTPTTTVLDRQIVGLTWRLYLADENGNNRHPVSFGIGEAAQDLVWTFTDGTPGARNFLVRPATTLILCARIDPAAAPVTITHVAGAIVGFVFDAQTISERELAGLASTP